MLLGEVFGVVEPVMTVAFLFQMVVEQSNIDHIMRGLQSTEGVRLHNHRKKLRQR